MRQKVLTALMITLVLLGGCTGGTAKDETRIMEWREQVLSGVALSFDMKMTVDDGERVSEYELHCAERADEISLELLSPQLISGVTAKIRGRGTILEFDGLSLHAGAIDDVEASPLSFPSCMLNALEGGMLTQLRRENIGDRETLAFRAQHSENVYVDFWLCEETMEPLHAELLSDGQMMISSDILNWQIEED